MKDQKTQAPSQAEIIAETQEPIATREPKKIIANIKGLPSRFGKPRAKIGATVDFEGNPYTGKGIGFTSKDKAVLGVADEHTIVWVGLPLDKRELGILKRFAKACEMPAERVMANVLFKVYQEMENEMAEAGEEFLLPELTPEQIDAQIARIERSEAATRARLEALKAMRDR